MNDLSDPPVPNATNSKRNSEDPITNVFHKCPIKPESEMKRVEDEEEVSHLGKSEWETVSGGLPEKIPENPLLEKEDPKGLSAAVVF